jgi:hypothetical protein
MQRHLLGVVICCATALTLDMGTAAAQDAELFQIGAQIPVSRFAELDSTDVGIGARASWHPSAWIGVEGELNLYPRDIPDTSAVSRNRLEGLAGLTAGPRLKSWRPFARIRPGFLRVGASPEPRACILIFPPPASCALAGGEILFVLDIGAGIEVHTPGHTFVRLDLGDQMVTFPGPARDRDNKVHDDDYVRHELRVAIGGGWRF